MSAERIVGALIRPREIIGSNIEYGVVESLQPLQIRLSPRILLDVELIVGKACRAFNVTTAKHIHTTSQGNTSEALHSLQIWRGLEIGDTVMMFTFNEGQKYYVAEVV